MFPSKDQFSDFGSPRFADLNNSTITNHFLLKSTVPNKKLQSNSSFQHMLRKNLDFLDHGGIRFEFGLNKDTKQIQL